MPDNNQKHGVFTIIARLERHYPELRRVFKDLREVILKIVIREQKPKYQGYNTSVLDDDLTLVEIDGGVASVVTKEDITLANHLEQKQTREILVRVAGRDYWVGYVMCFHPRCGCPEGKHEVKIFGHTFKMPMGSMEKVMEFIYDFYVGKVWRAPLACRVWCEDSGKYLITSTPLA